MSADRVCPKCKAPEPTRVKRTMFDRMIFRRRVYQCDTCHHRFAGAGGGARSRQGEAAKT